jgi:hypothetical protein
LEIADKQSSDLESSAPLFRNHLDWTFFAVFPIQTLRSIFGIGGAFPDLILRYNKDLSKYNTYTALVWHELTHASQLQRMKSEKNDSWASNYWSAVVAKEIVGGYGSKGGVNWEIVALTEGWAYYRKWDLPMRHLNWNMFTDSIGDRRRPANFVHSFPRNYMIMYDSLCIVGCSYANIEKSLCSYSITGFRDNIISKYPSKRTQITNIIRPYE